MCSMEWSGFAADRARAEGGDEASHWACAYGPAGAEAEAAWRQPQSFAELTEVMVQFLQGHVGQTPEHGGPVDEETDEVVDYLIRFNRGGFMTVTSQPTELDEPTQIALVAGFASEDLAHRLHHLGSTGTLGVVITPPRTVGGRGAYGNAYPLMEGHPSPRWTMKTWAPALSFRAFAELRRSWYVVAFDTNDRDPMRLWRNILEVIDGPPTGWSRLFDLDSARGSTNGG